MVACAENQLPSPNHLASELCPAATPPNPHHPPSPPSPSPSPSKHLRHIWLIIGPAGCGKSTVAQFLASRLNLPYIEGDDVSLPLLLLQASRPDNVPLIQFHPPQNITKMANGVPLTDEDRWGWLATLRNEAVAKLATGGADGCIVTCSCLKLRYRDVIRAVRLESGDIVLRFMYLRADEELVLERVRARKGHYMKDEMVHSQFMALEEPGRGETDVVTVDVRGTRSDVQRSALEKVLQCMDSEECTWFE